MFPSNFKKKNPLIMGGAVALLYIVLFGVIDFLKKIQFDTAKRILVAAIFGILSYLLQLMVNKKVEALERRRREKHKIHAEVDLSDE